MADASKGKRKSLDDRDTAGQSSAKRGKKVRSRQQHANIHGPGIFVSCVRGKERKAAHELVEFLEEIADRLFADVQIEELDKVSDDEDQEQDMDAMRNGPVAAADSATPAKSSSAAVHNNNEDVEAENDIEDQIKAELADFKGDGNKQRKGGDNSQSSRKVARFVPIMTDMECCPLDPVKVTYALLEQVKRTGQARSRFVHRLSPVCDTVYADVDRITAMADRIIMQYFTSSEPCTFKVDVKMRLHTQLSRMDLVHALAKRMPDKCKAQLHTPEIVLNVEVFRMTCGVSLLPHYEAYRKLNPLMLAEQWHQEHNEVAARTYTTTDYDAPSRVHA